jgi:VanZ family protein|tara:strand:+ start:7870 stop:8223 length:354 start_codon:yes stop_codon:yes gene_type:complete
MAVIYALSDRPAVDYDGVDDLTSWLPFASSIAHVGLYFVLSMFVFRTITITKRLGFGMTAYLTLFTALAFGVLDELHQSNVEGRASEATDVVADVFGAVLVVVFWFGLRKYRSNASG